MRLYDFPLLFATAWLFVLLSPMGCADDTNISPAASDEAVVTDIGCREASSADGMFGSEPSAAPFSSADGDDAAAAGEVIDGQSSSTGVEMEFTAPTPVAASPPGGEPSESTAATAAAAAAVENTPGLSTDDDLESRGGGSSTHAPRHDDSGGDEGTTTDGIPNIAGDAAPATPISTESVPNAAAADSAAAIKIGNGVDSMAPDLFPETVFPQYRNTWCHKNKEHGNTNNSDNGESSHGSNNNHDGDGNGGGGNNNEVNEDSAGSSSSDGRGSSTSAFFFPPPALFPTKRIPHDGSFLKAGEELTGALLSPTGESAIYASLADASVIFSTRVHPGSGEENEPQIVSRSVLIEPDPRKLLKLRRIQRDIAEDHETKETKKEKVLAWQPFGKAGWLRRREREHVKEHEGEVNITISDKGVLRASIDGRTVMKKGAPSWPFRGVFRRRDPSYELRVADDGFEITREGREVWRLNSKHTARRS